MKRKALAETCNHGLTNPLSLVIACKCEGCEGELHSDGSNTIGTQGFLVCTVCRCVYTISATREARR